MMAAIKWWYTLGCVDKATVCDETGLVQKMRFSAWIFDLPLPVVATTASLKPVEACCSRACLFKILKIYLGAIARS